MALDLSRERHGSKNPTSEPYVSAAEILANVKPASVQNADRYLTKFKNDTNSFIKSVNSDFGFDTDDEEEKKRKSFNAADFFEERRKQADELKSRLAKASQSLEANSEYYNPEYYNAMAEYLSNFDTMVDDVLSYYKPSLDAREGMRAYEDEFIAAQERNEQFKSLDRQALFGLDNTSPAYNLLESMMRYRNDESYRGVNDNWTEEERYTLGQLQKEDPAKARDYATQVNNYYNAQSTESVRENIRQNAVANKGKSTAAALLASTFTAPGELADRLAENMARGTTTEKRYVTPTDYAQEVTGAISQDLNQRYGTIDGEQYRQFRNQMANDLRAAGVDGNYDAGLAAANFASGMVDDKGVGDIYNLGYNVAQNALSRYALGSEFGVLSNYFMSAATSGIDEARRVGATGNQAVASGVLKGAWEVLTEMAPLDKLFKMGPAVTWGDLFKTLGKQGMSEALGEGVNSALGYISDQLVLGDLSEYSRMVQEYVAQGETEENAKWMAFRDAAQSVGFEALSGALSGWASGGIETVGKTAQANLSYRNVDAQSLINEGMETNTDSKSYALAQQMQQDLDANNNISGNQKRVLGQNIQLQQLAEEKAAAEAAATEDLMELGQVENLEQLADLVARKSIGEDLSWKDKRTIRKNQNVQTLLSTMEESSSDSSSSASVPEASTFRRTTENTQVSKDGRAIQISTDNPVDVLDFASMDNGVATVQLNDGETAAYDDIAFKDQQQANQFYAVRSLPGLDTESANNLLHTIQDADAGKDIDSVVGIREAYAMGYYNQSESNLAKGDAAALTPELRKAVFDIGRQQNQAQEKIQPKVKAVTAKPTQGYKKITVEGKITKLDKKREAEMAYVDTIADNFAGTAVHVYESYVGADGKRYFRDNNGVKHKAPNGKYINGEIWLDINSGDNGEGMMLNTFAHEMYHHIEKFNKEKANELASFVSRELGIENVEAAVQDQIDKARAAGYGEDYFKKQGMTDIQATNEVYARAMSDFVADSLETMFTRGDPAKAIANLKKENKGLFDQIKAFIDEWISKVKKFYSDKTISQEGAAVAQLEKFEQLQQLFMEAMQGAGENYLAAEVADEKSVPREKYEKFSFAGRESATADKSALQQAEELAQKGVPNETIRKQTGWYKGIDGKWRYEIDDSQMEITDDIINYMSLGELMQHEKLYAAYPDLADISVVFQGLDKGVNGAYNAQFDSINLSYRLKNDPVGLKDALVHEIQHAIQHREGFTSGATVGQWERKIKAGFDSRRAADIRKAQDTERELRRIQNEEPEFYRDMMELDAMTPDLPRGEVDWETLEKISDDPIEWQQYDARREELEAKYGDTKVWDMNDLLYQREQAAKNVGRSGVELYFDTAGEIEARDASNRRSKSPEQRKSSPPILGNEDTVFAEGNANETERFSLRNEKPLTDREILAQIDPSKRNETERYFLGQYQDRLKEISEEEPRLAAIKKQMESLDPKKDKAKLSELRIEAGKIQRNVTYLKKKVRESEGFDMFKRMAKEERNNRSVQKYKEEQKQKIKDMQMEQRILRAQLKKTDDFASVMGEELAKLSKDYEEKKIDLKTMEDRYKRLSREYESAKARVEQKKETQNVQKQRKYVEDHAKKLMKMLANPTKDAHVPMALQEPLKKFLDSIDFTSNRQATGGAATNKDRAYSKALRAVQEAVEGQRSAMTNEDGVFTLDVPPEFIDRIKEHVKMIEDAAEGLDTNTNRVYEMTSAELKDLSYILGVINKAIGMIDKFHMQGEKARTSGFSKETVQEMERRKPVKGEDGSRFIWNNYTPFHAFRAYGKAAQKIFTGLTEGQGKLARTIDSVIKFTEKTYTAKEVRGWERERHTIKLESGKTVTMSTAQIMTFWCLSHRDQAIPHMQGGGIRMTTLKKFIEGASVQQELVQKEHFTLTIADINRINNMLTDRQQEVARKLQQFMQTVGGRLVNEISMARWDYMAATEHDYFPIQTENVGRDAKNPDQEKTSLFALLNKSFTKAPVKNSKNALIIDSIFNVFANHMSEVAEYNAFALPLVDAMKWFNYKERLDLGNGQIKDISVHGSIRDTLGKNAEKYFIDLMTDINSSQKAGRDEDLFGKILGRSKVASVAWNTRVAIQQISALPRASMILNAKSLMAGASKFRLKSATEEMMKYSGIALWKSMGYYDLNVARSVERQIKGDTSIVDKFNELGMWLPGKMDERTWARIWLAAKDQVRKNTNLTGEALLQSTAKLFEDVVYQTQVVDSVLAKSSLMRSKSQLIKEATSFMAEPTLSLNNLMSAFQDYDETHTMSEKVKRGLMIGFTGYCLSAVANALLVSISDAGRDDDEFETFWEKYIQALWGEKFFDGNLFGELNPIEKIAFVKDILSVVKGNEPHSSYSKLLTGAVDLVNAYQNVAEGKGSKTVYGVVHQTLQYLSTTSGLALSNMTREVVDIWNNTIGNVNPELKLKRYKPDNADELLTAIKKGTEEDFQRVFGRYESQEKAESALQSAIGEKYRAGEMSAEEATQLLTDYFDREEYEVYWILDKWDYAVENGTSEGYSKYGAFLDAIDNGGDYVTEIQRYLEHGSEMSDIRSAISGKYKKQYLEADEAAREEIRDKIMPAFMETGMYEDEIEKKFHEWDFEAEYGYTFSAYKAAYRDGEITESELRSAMKFYGMRNFEIDESIRDLKEDIAFRKKFNMTLTELEDAYDHGDVTRNTLISALEYSGMTRAQAKEEVAKRDISNQYGIDYMKMDDAYKAGDITRQDLYNSMIKAGSTKKEADDAIVAYDWLKQNYKKYPDLAVADAKKFVIKISDNDEEHTLADYGVTIDHYIQYAKLKPDCKGVDANGDGKTDSGTLRDSIFRMIDSLPISDSEKDGLALISYGIKSIRKNAPWHKK